MSRRPERTPFQVDNTCFKGDQPCTIPADSFSRRFGETTETLEVGLIVRPPLKPLPAQSPAKSSFLSVSRPISLLFGAFALFASIEKIAAESLPVGVQRTDLVWLDGGKPKAAEAVINVISEAGPDFIRINVQTRKDFDAVAGHIRAAKAKNLDVLLQLASSTDSEVYPPGTEKRPGRDSLWPSFPISQTDPAAFESWLEDLFTVLKREEALPNIVQTGNELNWCAFNGDYPVFAEGEGMVYSATNWEALPEAIREGARRSGWIAATTSKKLREWFPNENERPKVILGSLNKPADPEWLARSGGTFLLPEIFLAIASSTLDGMPAGETEDYLKELDGISLHFYPSVANRKGAALSSGFRDYLREFMEPVRKVTPLPAHITEFGFPRNQFETEADRAVALADFVKQMESSRYNFTSVAIFSWDMMEYALVDPATGKIDPAFPRELGWNPK